MTGLHILIHSVQMIFRNFGSVVKLALVPTLIFIGVFAGLFTLWEGASFGEGANAVMVVSVIAAAFVGFACILWFIVAWHRFVLLEEYPSGWVSPFRGGRILSYAAYSLLVSIILLICLVVPLFLLMPMVFETGNFSNISVFVNFVSFVGTMFFFRLSVILPSAAIGRAIGFSAAWSATKGSMGTMAVITAGIFAANFAVSSAPVVFGNDIASIFVQIIFVVLSVFVALLNVSILTTLYGHYVEGRPVTG